jgi:hypothetical protein
MSPRAATAAVRVAALLTACVSVPLALEHPAHAQTTVQTAGQFVVINYEEFNTPSAFTRGFVDIGGSDLFTSGEVSYSFGDGRGISLGAEDDTIRLYGDAWARVEGLGFGGLKAGVSATLENGYLDLRDVENAPNDGGIKAPSYWIAGAQASWTLRSRFVSSASVVGNSYTIRWIFSVDGVENRYDDGAGFAALLFNYAGNSQLFQTTSLLPEVWATPSMPVSWQDPVVTSATFFATWQYDMLSYGQEVRNNSSLIGYLAPPALSGTVDYASTLTLSEIQVFDQSGARFYDFHVEDESGNRLYTGSAAAAAAPEPGTLGLVALGVLLPLPTLRRRRRFVTP